MPSAIFNSMKPLIGITGNIHIMNEKDNIPGLQRDYVNRSYALSVKMSGGLPLIIPAMEDEEGLRSILGRIDGLILSGGYDIAPDLYGEEPRRLWRNVPSSIETECDGSISGALWLCLSTAPVSPIS